MNNVTTLLYVLVLLLCPWTGSGADYLFMSISVFTSISLELHVFFRQLLCLLPMDVSRSSSGGVKIVCTYVGLLPVL